MCDLPDNKMAGGQKGVKCLAVGVQKVMNMVVDMETNMETKVLPICTKTLESSPLSPSKALRIFNNVCSGPRTST